MIGAPRHGGGARALLGPPLRWLALIGGIVLFAIMLLVSAAVFFRYVLNQPILGDQELVEIGMSVVVMMAMPFTAMRGQHIRVDIFDRKLGDLGRYCCDIFARVLSVFVLVVLINKTWDKTLDAHEYGDVTNMIEIPVWITYGSITIGMAFYIVVLIVQLFEQFRHGVKGYHE